MRQSNLQLQNDAALMPRRIQAVAHGKGATGLAGAHPGFRDRILLNYTRIEDAHEARKSLRFFVVYRRSANFGFVFSMLRHYQMPECFCVNNC